MKDKTSTQRRKGAKVNALVLLEMDCKTGTIRICQYQRAHLPFSVEVWAPLKGDWQPFVAFSTRRAAAQKFYAAIARFGGEVGK